MSTSTLKGRRFAVLVALSLVAGLLAVSAPAYAAADDDKTGTPEALAEWSSCIGSASAAAGFGDVATGAFYENAVNCAKYYGITAGTSASKFDPNVKIPRWQMAIFLAKVADLGGVTMPSGDTGPFDDIGGESDAAQTAINQIAALGITSGKGATTFAPKDLVTRWEMAIFVETLLSKIKAGPGGSTPPTGQTGATFVNAWDSTYDINTAPDKSSGFTDLGSVTSRAASAVEEIFDLGVTAGKGSATTFAPFDNVTRGEMVTFLAAAMKHTNIKPADTSVQLNSDGDEALFSYRDSSFRPVANQPIDWFYQKFAKGATETAPVDGNGLCITANVVGSGTTECVIDNGDLFTNLMGNATPTLPALNPEDTLKVWAWSGALGTTFDLDSTAVGADSVTTDAAVVYPTGFKTSVNTTKNAGNYAGAASYNPGGTSTNVHFGQAFTVTMTATGATNANLSLAVFTVKETRYLANGSVTVTTSTASPDASGVATYTVAAATDVNPTTNNATTPVADATTDEVFVKVEVTAKDTSTAKAALTAAAGSGLHQLAADDEAAVYQTTNLSSAGEYAVAGAGGSMGFTAKSIDQYGDGWSGALVSFTGNPALVPTPQTRTTTTSGTASISVPVGATNGSQAVSITVDSDGIAANPDDAVGTSSVTVYWVTKGTGDGTGYTGVALIDDTDNDAFVISSAGTYYWFAYDSGDVFNIPGNSGATLAEYETYLKSAAWALDTVAITYRTEASTNGISTFTWTAAP